MTKHTTTKLLPLPQHTPPLTANQRLHWAQKARITKQLRHTTHILAKTKKLPTGTYATITLHYVPATNRRRDRHNLWPTVKAAVDGLIDYGLVPDDDHTHVSTPEPVIHPADRSPRETRLWLEITIDQEGTCQ